jgi:hypothetical protein
MILDRRGLRRIAALATYWALLLGAPPASAASAIETVVKEVAAALRSSPASVVVAGPLVSDQPSPRGDDLALRMAALLAGRMGAGTRTHPATARLATARAVAGRASALVYLQPQIGNGDLRLTADVYPTMANAWDRIRNPLPAPASHAFASAPVDAEVRTFLTPLLLEQTRVDRFRHEEGEVLAVACGDVDGDGGDELALVSRSRIALGRLRGGDFVLEKVAPWTALALRAPVIMREPLAGAVLTRGSVDVGSTERGSVSLGPDLGSPRTLVGIPAWGGDGAVCLMPEPSAGAFDGAPVDCAVSRDPKPALAVPAPRFDTFAAAQVTDGAGATSLAVAVREPSGKLRIKRGENVIVAEGPFGSALAVGDLDQDGSPEIAATTEAPEDAIVVSTLSPEGAEPRERLRVHVPEAVRALAVCPPEEHARPSLVAVVGNEIWVLRAGASDGTPATTTAR